MLRSCFPLTAPPLTLRFRNLSVERGLTLFTGHPAFNFLSSRLESISNFAALCRTDAGNDGTLPSICHATAYFLVHTGFPHARQTSAHISSPSRSLHNAEYTYRISLPACGGFSVCLMYLGSSACAHLTHVGILHVGGNMSPPFSRTPIKSAFHGPQDTRPITSCMWRFEGGLCARTNMVPIIPSFPMREKSVTQMSPHRAEEQLP